MRFFLLTILLFSFQYSNSQELISGSLLSCCNPASAEVYKLNTRLEKIVFSNDILSLSGTWVGGCGRTDSLEFRLQKVESDTIFLTMNSTKKGEEGAVFCVCEYKFNLAMHEIHKRNFFLKINNYYVPADVKRYRMDGFKKQKYRTEENGQIKRGYKEIFSENNKVLVEVFYENDRMVFEKFYDRYGNFKYIRNITQ